MASSEAIRREITRVERRLEDVRAQIRQCVKDRDDVEEILLRQQRAFFAIQSDVQRRQQKVEGSSLDASRVRTFGAYRDMMMEKLRQSNQILDQLVGEEVEIRRAQDQIDDDLASVRRRDENLADELRILRRRLREQLEEEAVAAC